MSTGDPFAQRLGAVLRTARYVREMSRETLARRCEVTTETIARWERANVAVPGHALSRLADVLELPADLLIDPPVTRTEIVARIALADEARRHDLRRRASDHEYVERDALEWERRRRTGSPDGRDDPELERR